MQEHCGVIRSKEGLELAMAAVQKAKADMQKVFVDDKSDAFNTDVITALELNNLVLLGEATVMAAQERTESRGAQARRDYPKRDDENWMVHITSTWKDGVVTLGRDKVRLVDNPEYAPAERKY